MIRKNVYEVNNRIKVSIVVPVYNVECYLRECIESLINQTLQEIEIICVNDGSTDSSLTILEEFANQDTRIRIISKENSGYGHTMNVGFEAAKGEYIGIVESDDYALPNMFETLYSLAKQHDVDMVKSNYYEHSELIDRLLVDNLRDVPYDKVICPVEHPELFMTPGICIWSAIYRNSYIKEYNIEFNETPGASYQDVSFGYTALLHAQRLLCIKEAFLCYRVDNMNSSMKSREKVFCIMDEFERWQNEALVMGEKELIIKTYSNKFEHCLGHYYRVDELFKYAFIIRFVDILNRDYQEGLIEKLYWKDMLWNIMQQIRTNMAQFYQSSCNTYRSRCVLGRYTCSEVIRELAVQRTIENAENVIIYGAGKFGMKVYNNLKKYQNVKCFAVSNTDENQKELETIPVRSIKELAKEEKGTLIIVAVKWDTQLEILKLLQKLGFTQVVSVYDCLELLK